MKIFGINEAKYYCSRFRSTSGNSEKSINDFQKTILGNKKKTFTEGTPLFQQFQDCSLREIERSLFLAVSHYRRALDLMISSSSPWAFVTLYYGSWYASRALLGMFGCTIFSPKWIVDVDRGIPGNQRLSYRQIGNKPGQEPNTYTGSHRIFWGLFYNTVQKLSPMVDPSFSPVLFPISGNPLWQIENRNNINYDTFNSIGLATDFDNNFDQATFPASLPGILNTQYRILETMLELSFSFINSFGTSTDALNNLDHHLTLREKTRHLIYNEKSPGLVRKTKKNVVI